MTRWCTTTIIATRDRWNKTVTARWIGDRKEKMTRRAKLPRRARERGKLKHKNPAGHWTASGFEATGEVWKPADAGYCYKLRM